MTPLPRALLPPEERALQAGLAALKGVQRQDGHWCFDLEADVTIPAEYILMGHFLGSWDEGLEQRLAAHIRSLRTAQGGWPLFPGGPMDVSATVKGYFALKAAGDGADCPHMAEARAAVLAHGGAERVNVFTRILLALFGQVPWHAVPAMPVQIMLLPRWAPFHLDKVSYWSRTVMVPLLVLMALKPRARNPREIGIQELFRRAPADIRDWMHHPDPGSLTVAFRHLDRAVRLVMPHLPSDGRRKAMEAAVAFVRQRLNGEDGLGAIFPAMVNAALMFHCLGMERDFAIARAALDKLVVDRPDRTFCQPCLSPVWDTALAAHAVLETGGDAFAAAQWLAARQVCEVAGDWARQRPKLEPGGWAFQYTNPHYPDLDDSAMVMMALHRADPLTFGAAIAQGAAWVRGMQSRNGGWGSFDADNTHAALNHIPFADHGALLDPPTADVTARCVGMLAQLGYGRGDPVVAAGLSFLLAEQEADGSWFGRWGTNYVYGTWSVLAALHAAGMDPATPAVERAVEWLVGRQRGDGGWGESGESYWPDRSKAACPFSTPTQTAWALLGLMAAGRVHHPAAARGIAYLVTSQNAQGGWDDTHFTAVGFPRVFYLRYHGYPAIFPVWALARYGNLRRSNRITKVWGI